MSILFELVMYISTTEQQNSWHKHTCTPCQNLSFLSIAYLSIQSKLDTTVLLDNNSITRLSFCVYVCECVCVSAQAFFGVCVVYGGEGDFKACVPSTSPMSLLSSRGWLGACWSSVNRMIDVSPHLAQDEKWSSTILNGLTLMVPQDPLWGPVFCDHNICEFLKLLDLTSKTFCAFLVALLIPFIKLTIITQ